jgi:ATP/maltotriose-dependent transcriptional regulator MalT
VLLAYRDRHDEAQPLLQEGFERCMRRGDRGFAATALDYQALAAVMRGDLAGAEELTTRAFEIAAPRGDFYDVGMAACHLAMVKILAGDLDAGRRAMEPILRAVEGTAHTVYVPHMAATMGRLSLLAGEFEAARSWYARDVSDAGPFADGLLSLRCLPGLAAALRHLGRTDEAAAVAERAAAAAHRMGVPHLRADALDEQAHLAELAGAVDTAEELFHQALTIRVEHDIRTFAIDGLDALARLAAGGGAHAKAARLLTAADAARAAVGYPRPAIDEPRHRDAVAAVRDALGDRFAEEQAAGAALSLDEALALARRTRGSRGRPSTGWASLTPTELDVARCVAEGLSNPQIGDRLFMSRGTVKTHLSHIYAKVGVANRTELATVAARSLEERSS